MKNVECRIKTRPPKAPNPFLHSAFFILHSRVAVLFGLALFAIVVSLNASTQPSHRWLLVVDTSRSMKDRAQSVSQVTDVLVRSGMNGQMRRGDTLGIWTFNDTVHSGSFPLQEWVPELARNRASKVDEFLRGRQYEKESRLDKLWPALERIIQGSEFLTVVLIGDGQKISGTPFDDRINASYQNWQSEQRKRRMPIVTLLRVQKGRITDFTVGAPPWPMDFPPLPAELVRVEPKETKPAEAQPRSTLPPLILSGKKPEAAPPAPVPERVGPPVAPPAEVPKTAPEEKPKTDVAVAKEPAPATPAPAPPESPKPAPRVDPQVAVPPPVASPPPSEAPKTVTPVQSTATVPAEPVLNRRNLLIGASVLAGVLMVAVVLLMRRSRSPDRVSLITRSLDREQE